MCLTGGPCAWTGAARLKGEGSDRSEEESGAGGNHLVDRQVFGAPHQFRRLDHVFRGVL